MEKLLIVIDMQDNFLYHADPLRQKEIRELKLNIIDLIKVFMVNSWPIILVEYNGNEKTCQEILDTVNGYHKLHKVYKDDCDGSEEIIETIEEFGLPNSLNICGVYSDECVFQTKEGLKEYDSIKYVIHKDCVWPFLEENEVHGRSVDKLALV